MHRSGAVIQSWTRFARWYYVLYRNKCIRAIVGYIFSTEIRNLSVDWASTVSTCSIHICPVSRSIAPWIFIRWRPLVCSTAQTRWRCFQMFVGWAEVRSCCGSRLILCAAQSKCYFRQASRGIWYFPSIVEVSSKFMVISTLNYVLESIPWMISPINWSGIDAAQTVALATSAKGQIGFLVVLSLLRVLSGGPNGSVAVAPL